MRGVSACLALCRSYLKTSQGHLLKTFPGNLLKPFLGNPLKRLNIFPFLYVRCLLFCGSIAPCRRLSSRYSFFLVCDLSLLKRRVFPIASRLALSLLSPSRRPVIPIVRPCHHQAVLPAHRHPPRLAHASRPSSRLLGRPAQPTRKTGRKTGRGRLLGWFVLYDLMRCYMPGILVIYHAFLLYIWRSCYISRIFVIYLAFLLYAWRFCYISRILVISTCFMLYYFVEVMRLWAGVFN